MMFHASHMKLFLKCVCAIFAITICACQQNPDSVASKKLADTNDREQEKVEKPVLHDSQLADLKQLELELLSKAQPVVPGVWLALPDWLSETDLPFHALKYFDHEPGENGATHYLRAAAMAEPLEMALYVPGAYDSESETLDPEYKKLTEISNVFGDVRYLLLNAVFDPEDEVAQKYFETQGPTYAKRITNLLDELKAAHSLPIVQLNKGFSLDHLEPSYAFKSICHDLTIGCLLEPDSPRAIEMLDQMLQLERNIRKLGNQNMQLNGSSMVRCAAADAATAIIHSTEDPQHLEKLIDTLIKAKQYDNENPRFLEIVRFEYLQLRKLLHDLRTDSFQIDFDSWGPYGVDADLPSVVNAHKIMTSVIGEYRVNEEIALEAITDSLSDQPELLEQAKQTIAANKPKKPGPGSNFSPAAAISLPLLVSEFNSMNENDFITEIEILDSRLYSIERDADLPLADRLKKMELLRDQWTEDDSWRDSKFLKWHKPGRFSGVLTARGHVLINGAISLACVKKFQLENDQKLPVDVQTAVAAAGLADVEVFDLYSGAPFRLLSDESGVAAVYSFGPDRKDNLGQPALVPGEYNSDAVGDVVFTIR